MFDPVGDLRFHRLMNHVFKGSYAPSEAAHARRVAPLGAPRDMFHQQPVRFHIDAQYHSPHQFSLNFWVPLNDCGVDSPGLQTVPAIVSRRVV